VLPTRRPPRRLFAIQSVNVRPVNCAHRGRAGSNPFDGDMNDVLPGEAHRSAIARRKSAWAPALFARVRYQRVRLPVLRADGKLLQPLDRRAHRYS
jgi:hypothetical protein